MTFVVIGLSHRTAPIEVRERVAFSREETGEASGRLTSLAGVAEGIVLSTCNRTEVILASREETGHDTIVCGVRDFLASAKGIEPEALDLCLYAHWGESAVRHIFRVAASLDSMMVGEPQILGQVKESYGAGAHSGSVGPRLGSLLQKALGVAKRVRSSTGIARNPVSIAYAAAELAGRIFGSLDGRSVMVLGAGEMADLTARHLITAGVRTVYVASRTFHHAQEVAGRLNGIPIPFDRFKDRLAEVDLVIASTAAPHLVLMREDGQKLVRDRRGRPIFFIDIAVPRNIDPALNEMANVFLYDLDDLQGVVDVGLEERRREAIAAEGIVEEEVRAFLQQERGREAAPAIVELRERLHALAAEEIARFRGRLGPLSESQERAIHELTVSLMNKVLHGPTRELKRSWGQAPAAEVLEMVRRMFGLAAGEAVRDRKTRP